jgi:hypothetical protein
MRFVDITGQRFGRLTVIKPLESRYGQRHFQCRCDCGRVVTLPGGNIRSGNTRSCGCLRREATSLHKTVHGAARRERRTVEYVTWKAIMQRCYNPNNPDFKYYGGRGIKVCDRWHDFRNFLADMGPRPAGRYSIERVDVNGDYEPSNCIWLLHSEQSKNRR